MLQVTRANEVAVKLSFMHDVTNSFGRSLGPDGTEVLLALGGPFMDSITSVTGLIIAGFLMGKGWAALGASSAC